MTSISTTTTPTATTSTRHIRPFAIAAAIYTALGLLGGLGYREITRGVDLDSFTQLSVVHTHLLILGTVLSLIFMILEELYGFARGRLFTAFFWVYNLGVALSTVMMTVIGIRQVSGAEHSKALAGISGTGHILITAGFIMFFILLFRAIKERSA
ncbi:MAG: DUF2871 family protein [Flaviflexus sp.]|nr:DUF2871 family protein [Flaviflexus sp.]